MPSYKNNVTEAKRLLEVMEAGHLASFDLARLCHVVIDLDGLELDELAADIGRSPDYVDHLRRRGKRHEAPMPLSEPPPAGSNPL